MPGTVGAGLTLAEKIFSFFTDEDGFREMRKRRALAKKKEEVRRAVYARQWDRARELTAELLRLSDEA
jgi:hypothetical protein